MTELQYKAESLPVRCEICHQSDKFDPMTGFCTRCSEAKPSIAASSTKKLTIFVDLQLSDLLRANYWFFYSNRLTKILLTIVVIGISLYGYTIFSNFASGHDVTTELVPLLPVLAFCVIFNSTVYFNTKSQFSSLKDFQKKLRYSFSYDGYDIVDGKSSSHVSWDSIQRAVESKFGFHLFIQKNLFHFLPKRCLQQESDAALIRDILKSSLGDKAKIR
jgi:hypothetical protein